MVRLEGTLEFLGWHQPWSLNSDRGSIDFSGHFWDFSEDGNGQKMRQECTPQSYGLVRDEQSDYHLSPGDRGAGILLLHKTFGFTNVLSYLELIMFYLNGRQVVVDVTDTQFSISAAPNDTDFAVKSIAGSNSARIPEGAERTICKVGTTECCLFLTAGTGGFECAKFDGPLTRMLLDRKVKGTIRARRIGSCKNVGREDAL